MYDIFKSKIKSHKSKILKKLKLRPKEYLLLTIHRQENADNPKNLKSILSALVESEEKVVFPIHPRTKKALKMIKSFEEKDFKNFLFIEPVSYLDMLALEKNAKKILTDSGGVQKEAYWFGVPCITLRNETEWVETVEAGWNTLVGFDVEQIRKAILKASLGVETAFPYGDGRAGERIIDLVGTG